MYHELRKRGTKAIAFSGVSSGANGSLRRGRTGFASSVFVSQASCEVRGYRPNALSVKLTLEINSMTQRLNFWRNVKRIPSQIDTGDQFIDAASQSSAYRQFALELKE
jgi:hypothetical protein